MDRVEQVAAVVVAVLARLFDGFILRQVGVAALVTDIGVEVELDPEFLAVLVDQHVGVAGIAVHLAPVFRHAAIAHQVGDLVRAFGRQRPEIPHHVVIAQAVIRPALLAADEVLEFQRIADEEDRRVVADHVEIAILGIELDREAARIAPGIGAPTLARHGGEAHRGLALRAGLEDLCLGIFRDVRGRLPRTERARTLGVGLAFGNPLAIEVGHLLDQVVIVQDDRAIGADGQRMLVALDGDTGIGGGGGNGLGHGAQLSLLE